VGLGGITGSDSPLDGADGGGPVGRGGIGS